MNRSMDGVVSAGAIRQRPTHVGRSGEHVAVQKQTSEVTERATTHIKTSWKERLQLPLIIVGGMLAGFAIQSALLGQILIVAYGVACFVYHIPSRVSFALALGALFATTGLLIFAGNVMLSQTFATYTFLLLVVGVITLNRELKKGGGRVYSRRPRI